MTGGWRREKGNFTGKACRHHLSQGIEVGVTVRHVGKRRWEGHLIPVVFFSQTWSNSDKESDKPTLRNCKIPDLYPLQVSRSWATRKDWTSYKPGVMKEAGQCSVGSGTEKRRQWRNWCNPNKVWSLANNAPMITSSDRCAVSILTLEEAGQRVHGN